MYIKEMTKKKGYEVSPPERLPEIHVAQNEL